MKSAAAKKPRSKNSATVDRALVEPPKQIHKAAPAGKLSVFSPPKDESEQDRALRWKLAKWSADDSWRLYRSTKNGEHAWEAYRIWRALAGDAPLPAGLLTFFDQCAFDLQSVTTRDGVCRAVGLGAKGAAKNRRGGPTRRTKAAAEIETQGIVDWLWCEKKRRAHLIERSQSIGNKLPLFDDLFREAAREFGKARGTIANIASRHGLTKRKKSRQHVRNA